VARAFTIAVGPKTGGVCTVVAIAILDDYQKFPLLIVPHVDRNLF
jgi:hypothetical protein